MIKPISFAQANRKFGPPEGMTEEQCGELHAFVGADPNGVPVIISCFELSDEDIETLKKTKVLWLWVFGQGMPPVAITSEKPFNEIEA